MLPSAAAPWLMSNSESGGGKRGEEGEEWNGGEVSKIVFSLMLRGDDRKWEVVKADMMRSH